MGNYWCPACQRDVVCKHPSGKGFRCYNCRTDYETPKFRCFKCDGTEEKEGCYVATFVYGSYDCPEVWTLRRFRDHTLSRSLIGKAFIPAYYSISPHIVKFAGGRKWFHSLWKPALNGMVRSLQRREVSSYELHEQRKRQFRYKQRE